MITCTSVCILLVFTLSIPTTGFRFTLVHILLTVHPSISRITQTGVRVEPRCAQSIATGLLNTAEVNFFITGVPSITLLTSTCELIGPISTVSIDARVGKTFINICNVFIRNKKTYLSALYTFVKDPYTVEPLLSNPLGG